MDKFERGYAGLTSNEVTESRKRWGSNTITPPKRESVLKLYFKKFEDPIIHILVIAALLSLLISFFHGGYIETIGILFAILLATGIGFWFELDANKKFDLLNRVNDETPVKVKRDGKITEIPKSDIVAGDLIFLDTGEEIPADGVIIESFSLSVNESALTGELITPKGGDSLSNDEFTYPANRLYRGTTIIEGHCSLGVTSVGDDTEFGKLAEKSSESLDKKTPLSRQLESLAGLIGFIGIIIAVLLFVTLYVQELFLLAPSLSFEQILILTLGIASLFVSIGKIWMPMLFYKKEQFADRRGWLFWILSGLTLFIVPILLFAALGYDVFSVDSLVSIEVVSKVLGHFMVAVTLIVVVVPEGLPMAVTLSLAMSMRRMLSTNNLVRKMHATETIGATTVICTDKTGTLTKNEMRVSETFFTGDRDAVIVNIAVNSTAHLDTSESTKPKGIGNPTESALLLWLYEKGINYTDIRDSVLIVEQLPFTTETKYMATLIKSADSGEMVMYIKGAPEIVINMCNDTPPNVMEMLGDYQKRGMRTLAFGALTIPNGESDTIERLINRPLNFMGVVAISDPVREDVPNAVLQCLNAGIDIKMVTGDTRDTAVEIGREIGLISSTDSPDVVTISGTSFASLSNEEASEVIPNIKIMYRARPGDKQRLVELLQQLGEVVAVTGDGTNDAPALNYADVGLSMGSGTSVAKEASDITLMDDSFNSIAHAVMWGRSLYLNIQRFIIFQLTINLTAMGIVFLGTLLGHEPPLTITQMLWVNLIMDTFAAGALASLPPERGVMMSKPRSSKEFIITPAMRLNIIGSSVIFTVLLLLLLYLLRDADTGLFSRYNLTIFFTSFVMIQFWNLFNVKFFKTTLRGVKYFLQCKIFFVVLSIILVGQILIVQFGGDLFRTTPLKIIDWLLILIITSSVMWIGYLIRYIRLKLK